MKLSEKDIVTETKQVKPVVLIDDAWMGLDETRKSLLRTLLLDSCQKIITTTNRKNELWKINEIGEVIEL